jgi:hypothetical protein
MSQSARLFENDDKSAKLLVRFLSTEALRFSHDSIDGLMQSCFKADKYYQKFSKVIDS